LKLTNERETATVARFAENPVQGVSSANQARQREPPSARQGDEMEMSAATYRFYNDCEPVRQSQRL